MLNHEQFSMKLVATINVLIKKKENSNTMNKLFISCPPHPFPTTLTIFTVLENEVQMMAFHHYKPIEIKLYKKIMTSLLKRINQKHYEEQNAERCFAKKTK